MKENYFDTLAKGWNTPQRKNTSENIKEIILNKFDNKPHSQVKALEIGAGDGILAILLSEYFSKIDCIDSSSGMREEFLKNKEKFMTENIFIYDESFLSDNVHRYDLIYSQKAFHHIVDIEAELRSLKEVIDKDGVFYLIDLCTVPREFHNDFPDFDGHDGFSKDEIYTYFENTGWEVTDYEIIMQGKRNGIDFSMFIAVGKVKQQ